MSTEPPATSTSPGVDDDAPAHRYTAALAREIELRWQDCWDADGTFEAPNPAGPAGRPRRRRRARPQAVRARHVPVPVGHRPARRPPARLHRHRRLRPLPADGRAQRAVHDGLRRVRPAGRAVRRRRPAAPGDHDRGEHRHLPPAAAPARAEPRPAARRSTPPTRRTTAGRSGSSCRSSTSWYDPDAATRRRHGLRPADRRAASPSSTPAPATLDDGRGVGDAVAVRAGRRHRRPPPGLRRRRAGQLVPRPGHGRRQRGGHRRRPQRPRQLPRVQAQHAPVDDAHHRLRRPPDRRPRPARLARLAQDDAAQLDRPLARRPGRLRLARPGRSPCSRPAPTRCSAPRSWCSRPSTRWSPR